MNKFLLLILVSAVSVACSDVISDPDDDLKRKGIQINSEQLSSKEWKLKSLFDDGKFTESMTNYIVYFDNTNEIIVEKESNQQQIRGNWALAQNNTLLVIRIDSDDEIISELYDEWIVTQLSNDRLEIAEEDLDEDTRFTFESYEPEVIIIAEDLKGDWRIANSDLPNKDKIENGFIRILNDAKLEFVQFNGIKAEGLWQFNSDELTLNWLFAGTNSWTGPINKIWSVVEVADEQITLKNGDHTLELTKYTGNMPDIKSFIKHSWQVKELNPLPNDDDDDDYYASSELIFGSDNKLTWHPNDDEEPETYIGSYQLDNDRITLTFRSDDDDDDDETYWNGTYTLYELNENEMTLKNDKKTIVLNR